MKVVITPTVVVVACRPCSRDRVIEEGTFTNGCEYCREKIMTVTILDTDTDTAFLRLPAFNWE